MNALEISPAQFRQLANRVTSFAAEYLESLPTRATFPTEATGANTEERFGAPLPEQGM